jgi:hypothetical protein
MNALIRGCDTVLGTLRLSEGCHRADRGRAGLLSAVRQGSDSPDREARDPHSELSALKQLRALQHGGAMTSYRHALPQLSDRITLTDGGIETTLIYHEGIELPHFAAFVLLDDDAGRAALLRYFTHGATGAPASTRRRRCRSRSTAGSAGSTRSRPPTPPLHGGSGASSTGWDPRTRSGRRGSSASGLGGTRCGRSDGAPFGGTDP